MPKNTTKQQQDEATFKAVGLLHKNAREARNALRALGDQLFAMGEVAAFGECGTLVRKVSEMEMLAAKTAQGR